MDGIADYRFVRPLRRGNHGDFFLAEAPARLGLDVEHVVVKVLHAPATETLLRRATRELRAFAAVRSPHLVSLHDAGQDGSHLYYSMEHLPLGSLAEPAQPVGRDHVRRAVADAARAAHALHEAGLAHRDIGPETVLLTEAGGKLADLGLVHALDAAESITTAGGVGGIETTDPALLRGGSLSRAADVWSLGVTLHRALTGAGIYGDLPEDQPLLAIRKVLSSEPQLAPGLLDDERELVERCLRPEPADRFATAAELAAALDQLEPTG